MTKEEVVAAVTRIIEDKVTPDLGIWQCIRVWYDKKGQVRKVHYDHDASPCELINEIGEHAQTITVDSYQPDGVCEECVNPHTDRPYNGSYLPEWCNPSDCEECRRNIELTVDRVMSQIYEQD